MDGSGFDAWTRRRFGMAAGGLAASVAAMAGFGEAGAKNKKKCRKFGDRCGLGKNQQCCCPLQCGLSGECCRGGGQPCSTDPQCCSNNCFGDFCVCKSNGQGCTEDFQCCSGACVTAGMGKECQNPD
jgi:hypothetical protein